MGERTVITADLDFIRDLTKTSSGDTLKKCYQCATCSSVCPLSTEKSPFPRKEMLWAGWGLKEYIHKDADIWLCHQCHDCTAKCPRGAKPGDVISALRRKSIEHYVPIGIIAKLANSIVGMLVLMAMPIAILLGLLSANGKLDEFLSGQIPDPSGIIVFSKIFVQTTMVDPFAIFAATFAVISAVIAVKKFWGAMKENEGAFQPKMNLVSSLIAVVKDVLAHKKFQECGERKNRKLPHQMMVFAFIGLLIVTSVVSVNHYMLKLFHTGIFSTDTPYPTMNPIKLLANVSGVLLVIGILTIAINRLIAKVGSIGSWFDWSLIIVISGLAITGFSSELLRLAGNASMAYIAYFLHLTFIFYLFAFMPYTKFAHLVFRTTALVFAKHTGREVPLAPASASANKGEEAQPVAATA
jgi:quinone-modifying oxidoreductase subunit QmoC